MTTPRLTLDADGLARLRVALGREARSLQPVVYRPDGLDVTVALPGCDWLAVLLSLDGLDAYRRGRIVLARPTGSEEAPAPLDLGDLHQSLREALRTLPDRPDAGDAYLDLSRAASVPSATFETYLDAVLGSWRSTLPAAPRPEAPRRPSTARSTTERSKQHRARRRQEEAASALWALGVYLLDDEDGPVPEPGSRVPALDVFEAVSDLLAYPVETFEETVLHPRPGSAEARLSPEERLAEWQEIAEESDWPARPRLVARRVLFDVAEAHGFAVTKPQNRKHYTIPQEVTPMPNPAPLFTRSEILAEVARQEREATASADAEALVFDVEGFLAEVAASRLDG
jgi:hypothetical protein